MLRMMPRSPVSAGITETPAPRHVAFTTFAFTRTTLHGSPAVPAPRYLNPFNPGGFPSGRQPPAGSMYVLLLFEPVSKRVSEPPSAVGSLPPTPRSGRSNNEPVGGFATNLAITPVVTIA